MEWGKAARTVIKFEKNDLADLAIKWFWVKTYSSKSGAVTEGSTHFCEYSF